MALVWKFIVPPFSLAEKNQNVKLEEMRNRICRGTCEDYVLHVSNVVTWRIGMCNSLLGALVLSFVYVLVTPDVEIWEAFMVFSILTAIIFTSVQSTANYILFHYVNAGKYGG